MLQVEANSASLKSRNVSLFNQLIFSSWQDTKIKRRFGKINRRFILAKRRFVRLKRRFVFQCRDLQIMFVVFGIVVLFLKL